MRWILAAVGLLLSASVSLGGKEADDVLRSAKALDALLMSGRNDIRPFELTGRVLHACTPCRKSFFLDDGSNIVRLVDNAYWPNLVLKDGDIIKATGRTVRQGDKGINPDCHTIVRLGHINPPEPPVIPIREVLRHRDVPLRDVAVHGRIRDVVRDDIDHNFTSLILTDGDTSLTLSLMCPDLEASGLQTLIGAEVTAVGLIRTDECFDPSSGDVAARGNRRIYSPLLTIAGPSALRIDKPAPSDPFDVPELKNLHLTWPEDLTTASRCRTEGIVLTAARPKGFLLQMTNGLLANVDLMDEPTPQVGDRIAVAGLPVTDLYRINFTRAIWKRADNESHPVDRKPTSISIENLLTDGAGHVQYQVRHFGHRIRTSGHVRSLPAPGSFNRKITLESAGHLLSVVAEPGITPFADIVLDAEAEVTGICLMDVEPWRPGMVFPRITDVRIVVQSPNDIRITSRPSWWTARRLFVLVCILALAALGIAVWNITLRTLVIRKSRELLREQTHRLTETLRVEERTRLATELHDTVAQNLSGLSLQLDAAGRLADSDPSTMKSILAFASKALLACRRELRDCLWDLRSQALDERDMNTAIRRALTPHLSNIQLFTRFNVPRRKFADHTAHAVLRILGELANNAVKHGKAKTLRIAGSLDDEGLKFSCVDDGCGFDVKNTPGSAAGHFGLQGIRDRIRAFNGSFQLTSIQGKGTRAVIILHPAPLET